ncbi:hypothetical protein BH23CHL5_BH23CHL5_12520 [soil metagenome]
MRIVEVRFLEGPNVFMLSPAVKVEVDVTAGKSGGSEVPQALERAQTLVIESYKKAGCKPPQTSLERLETPGHFALVFSWDRRSIARSVADLVERYIQSPVDAETLLAEWAAAPTSDGDNELPLMIRDAERKSLTIAVTGTNGKTTTTRLIAHLFTMAGKTAGWSSSSGVYIGGTEVLTGDYSGPQGARRVLEDPVVEVAVIETARGGILLLGIACESFDISVFTNISADHLDLQGVHSVEGLARVKAVVSRVTRKDGYAVVNADDPLVMSSTSSVDARMILVSQQPESERLASHVDTGGTAVINDRGEVTLIDPGRRTVICEVADIPMTFGGAAGFMTENALCAAAAAFSGGLTTSQIRKGLISFQNSTALNPGRMNVFDAHGVRVIVDFAHNEAGLEVLLDFAHSVAGDSDRVISIIGTGGDRNEHALRELGRIGASRSDYVIAKGTVKYQRGRPLADIMTLYLEGLQSVAGAAWETSDNELTAVKRALEIAKSGDVIVVMAQEHVSEISDYLVEIGAIPR